MQADGAIRLQSQLFGKHVVSSWKEGGDVAALLDSGGRPSVSRLSRCVPSRSR